MKVPNATHESVQARNVVRIALDKLMHAETTEDFDSYLADFKSSFEIDYPIFFAYFEKMWLRRKELWSKAWRPVSINHGM